MANDTTNLIEHSGDGWYVSIDTTYVPEYLVLTLRGKPTVARTESFLTMMATHEARFTDTTGRYYPVIVDLSALPPPSLDSIKAGRAMVEAVSRKQSYLVYQVTPDRRRAALFGVLLGLMARLLPNRFTVATSREDAVAAIRAYHERAR